jgi:ankyrin repeat protein
MAEMVHKLLSSGANINAKIENRGTPLYYAAKNGNIDIVKSLLESGADCGRNEKETPFVVAVKNEHLHIAYELLQQSKLKV